MKIELVNGVTIVLITLLLSTILILYIFEFGFVFAQNHNIYNKNDEIDDDFDYIFDPGNYIKFAEEKKEKVVVRNDNSNNTENQNNLVKSTSSITTRNIDREKINSNGISTIK